MGERVRVVRFDGGLLAAKEAGERGPDALATEAELLRAVQGPGVVELVGMSDAVPPALLTRWVGSRSLADVPVPMAPEGAAALCLAVAATVGRLHRGGVVHAAVDPTHVLLDDHGRPVLCGFGSAGPIGGERRPALDVAGLGRLLEHLLGPDTAAGAAHGLSRSGRTTSSRRKALRRVAAQAAADDPGDRPSVSAFTQALRRATPDAHLAADCADAPSPLPPSGAAAHFPDRPGDHAPLRVGGTRAGEGTTRAGRSGGLLATLALLAVAAATYFGLSARWAPSSERRVDAPPVEAAPTTFAPTTSTPVADASAEAPVVEHAGRRYQVGGPGDVVLVGPWLCDGRDLAAVLQPADGTVLLFDDWAPDGGSLDARAVATVPGATELERTHDSPGCADLVVVRGGRALDTLTTEDLR